MLSEEIADPESTTPADLERTYLAAISSVAEAVGADVVLEATTLDRETVDALADGESPELTLSEAAAVLALQPDSPDVDTILLEARDTLLMGMSVAVVDVDTLAFDLGSDRTATAIQQQIEGRAPMSLAEYAEVRHYLAQRRP